MNNIKQLTKASNLLSSKMQNHQKLHDFDMLFDLLKKKKNTYVLFKLNIMSFSSAQTFQLYFHFFFLSIYILMCNGF